jgi:hypothetical protein
MKRRLRSAFAPLVSATALEDQKHNSTCRIVYNAKAAGPAMSLYGTFDNPDISPKLANEAAATGRPGGAPGTYQPAANSYQGNVTSIAQAPGAEGSHFAALLAWVSGNTGSIPSCNIISTPLPL